DGKQVAFSCSSDSNNFFNIYIKLVDGGAQKQLTTDQGLDLSPVWSPDGQYLAFSRIADKKRAILVIPVLGSPERKLLTTNEATPEGLPGRIDWSPKGDIIAYSDGRTPNPNLAISLLGVETLETHQLTSPPEDILGDTQPAFSPDGQMLAFVRSLRSRVGDVYVIPASGGQPRRLTFDNKEIQGLTWAPDGANIVFASARGGLFGLWQISTSGGEPELIRVAGETASLPTFSRQGVRLAYTTRSESSSTWRLDLSPSRGASRVFPLFRTAAWEGLA